MNIRSERKNGILVVASEGRLDAYESANLGKELETLVAETDTYLILDMGQVSYLSSGGLRVLLATQKKLSRRKGRLCLCCLTEYPIQVIKMAGMDEIFSIYSTVEEAVNLISSQENLKRNEKDLSQLPVFHSHQTSFHVYQASDNQSELKIVGNLMKLLHAVLEPADIRKRRFSETEYSIGLGALGGSLEECLPLLGEMITIGGTMVWLPTDGNDTPDFLIPHTDTGEVMIHTGLNLALDGGFNDIILIGAGETSQPVSLSDIYDTVFQIARERQMTHRSLVSIAMVADLDALYSSGIKISPIKKWEPENHELVTDSTNIGKWMDVNTEPKYANHTMVSFGIGLDLTSDLSSLPKNALDNMFYLHPSNVGSKKMLLHNHGVVFQHLKWQQTLDLDSEVRKIVREGEFADMRHLMDTTRVVRAIAGVSYISNIRVE